MTANYIPAPAVLADLRVKLGFDAARAEANRTAVYPWGTPPDNVCRYCGKHWQPPANTKIDGHARCLVPEAFQIALATLMVHEPSITHASIAAACDVSYNVVRFWYRQGRERMPPEALPIATPLPKGRKSVSMSHDVYTRLKAYADAHDVSMASIVEPLVEQAVAAGSVQHVEPAVERKPLTREELDARCAIRDALRNAKPCPRVLPEVPVSEGLLSIVEDRVVRLQESGEEATEETVLDAAIVGALDQLEAMTAARRARVLERAKEQHAQGETGRVG